MSAEENKLKPLKHPLDPEICQKAARYAVRVCEEMSKRSTLLREEDPDELNVALFERDEILPYLGECLGKGPLGWHCICRWLDWRTWRTTAMGFLHR